MGERGVPQVQLHRRCNGLTGRHDGAKAERSAQDAHARSGEHPAVAERPPPDRCARRRDVQRHRGHEEPAAGCYDAAAHPCRRPLGPLDRDRRPDGALGASARSTRRGTRSRLDRDHEPDREPGVQAHPPPAPPIDHAGARPAARSSHSRVDVVPERTFRERHGVRRGGIRRVARTVCAAAHARRPRGFLACRDGRPLPVRCARRLRPG